MEHSCEKCGSPVEDGRPFCPHCRAPQVRVLTVESSDFSLPPGSGDVPLIPIPGTRQFLDPKIAVRAAFKAGIAGVLLGIVPFLGTVLTGALAVYLYKRATGYWLSPARGARLAGAAGSISFAISAAFTVIQVFVFHAGKETEENLLKFLTTIGIDPADPNTQAMVHQLFTPSGILVSLVFALFLTVAMASIGGALVSVIYHSRPDPD